MAKIVIYDLHPTDVGSFLDALTPVQMEAVIGGYTISVININGGVNNTENTYYEGSNWYNFKDNKIYTIDYSRSNYNWFYL
ncbi:hypothetical protein JYQ62_25285 [Nostoc sp. UHCC 0702]|nr:hypothetical protein JYQ62_25285 [Nostoc sp. UHCC 0702]